MERWSWTDRETVAADLGGHLTAAQEQLLKPSSRGAPASAEKTEPAG